MKTPLIAAVVLCTCVFGFATKSPAGETFLLLHDTYDLHPPYSQNWYATPSEGPSMGEDTLEVFIRGDGKHGDFFGIISVDCKNPEYSEWLALGGYILPERVPTQAITKLRLEICSNGDPA